MDSSEQTEDNHLFFGKFKILKRIGCGSFGNVYKGINIIDKKNVAIKVELKEKGYNLLQKESYYLYNLKGLGIPELISYGYSGNYNVLVQTLLGESLGKIFYKNGNFFPLKDICMFTIQILQRIEYVHSKYLIHRDIKPENFLIGDPDKYLIYIIDFGLSKKYKSSRTNKHIQFKLTKKFTGTARYASINAVRGAEQSRRDDLEAVGYMLMYFFKKGRLPWQGVSCKEKAHKYAKIYNMKNNLNYKEFCKDMPEEIIPYMKYCRELPFDREPDYNYLRSLFESVLKRNFLQNDLKFSWISDYSILKDSEKILNKINPLNFSQKKQRSHSRIIKQLESSREMSREKEKNNNILINNKSQVNLINNNPIAKAKTHNLKNIIHKKYNSSWDIKGLKGKENDMVKSSIAKYDSIIEDEEPINNLNNNYFMNNNNINALNIKNISEKNNLNISNNGNLVNRYNSNNNLFYFSKNFNLNELSKSLVLRNNKSIENTLTMRMKTENENENTNKTSENIPRFLKDENYILKNNNYSPNIIRSFSYVKRYGNKIGEIKMNFKNTKPLNKFTRNYKSNLNNITNPINDKKVIPINNNSNNIIYNKKKGNKLKINDIKKLSINKMINANDIVKNGINPILVNKSKNLINSKIKIKSIKNLGNNTTKNKRAKILKPKLQNINIKVPPHQRSYTNVLKASTLMKNNNNNSNNNNLQNKENYMNQNKIKSSNIKKEHLKIHNLPKNLNNNIEGKINKIKNMHIHSNIKKEKNINYKKLNTEIIFKPNSNEKTNINPKRINKYKNLRHKINTNNGNLTLQNIGNEINKNNKIIPKSRVFHKTINSTINNSNNTIMNTIHSNNNNNTIISIYNNYNINKDNPRNPFYKDIPEINFDLVPLNNNNNINDSKYKRKYPSYNGYKLDNYNNYIHLNQRKSPTILNKSKNNHLNSYQSIISRLGYNSKNIFDNPINGRDYSYQEKNNNNLKNYFSMNGNSVPSNDNKKNFNRNEI